MYMMTTDAAKTRMIEIEAEVLELLRQFENDTGLTATEISLTHDQPRLGDRRHTQRRVQGVIILAALI